MRTLDDIRNTRDGGDLGDMLTANLEAARSTGPDPLGVANTATVALGNLITELSMHVERVTELNERISGRDEALAMLRAERDGARERATKAERNLQAQSDWRREHTCEATTEGRPNSHVAFEGRKLIEEKDATIAAQLAEIKILQRQRDRARETAHAASERSDTYRAENHDLRADLARVRTERDARFTARQVGDAQASEAELVSKPLRDSLHTARNRIANLEAGLAREMAANVKLANQAAEELAARRQLEEQLHEQHSIVRDLNARTEQLQEWLTCRERRQNQAEAKAFQANVDAETLRGSVRVIADVVSAEAVDRALDPDHRDHPDYHTALPDAVRQVRHEVRRIVTAKALVSPRECDHVLCTRPTCNRLEGHPGRV